VLVYNPIVVRHQTSRLFRKSGNFPTNPACRHEIVGEETMSIRPVGELLRYMEFIELSIGAGI